MPRPRNTVQKTRWFVYVPEDLSATIDILLLNPTTGRVQYNARSQLVEELLREWLSKQRDNSKQIG